MNVYELILEVIVFVCVFTIVDALIEHHRLSVHSRIKISLIALAIVFTLIMVKKLQNC